MKDETVRVTRITVVGGKVRLAVCKTQRGCGTTTKAVVSEDLSEVYEKRGKTGLDTEILRLCAKGKMKLIGTHRSVMEYREILANPDNVESLSEEKTDILLDDLETKEKFTGKTFAIRINRDDFLAGVLTVKIGDHVEYVPYGTKDMKHKPVKYFLLREQARAYLDYVRGNCPAYYQYKMEIVEKVNDEEFTGIGKIAKWCRTHQVDIKMPKKPTILGDTMHRVYRFPNREYKLEVEQSQMTSTYRFMRRKETLCESNRQLDIIQEMEKYKLK